MSASSSGDPRAPFRQLGPHARAWLGVQTQGTSVGGSLRSTLGGVLAIAGILVVSELFVGARSAGVLVASMGASAVLLFAVPDGPLSQPWAVFGGNLSSAVVGVTCARLIPDPTLASAVAVGVAIGTMQQLRCVHPPGGATALSAVVSGPSVHALGYQYVVTPVLLNVLVILTVALLFHGPSRRYPARAGRAS